MKANAIRSLDEFERRYFPKDWAAKHKKPEIGTGHVKKMMREIRKAIRGKEE